MSGVRVPPPALHESPAQRGFFFFLRRLRVVFVRRPCNGRSLDCYRTRHSSPSGRGCAERVDVCWSAIRRGTRQCWGVAGSGSASSRVCPARLLHACSGHGSAVAAFCVKGIAHYRVRRGTSRSGAWAVPRMRAASRRCPRSSASRVKRCGVEVRPSEPLGVESASGRKPGRFRVKAYGWVRAADL